MKSHCSSQAHEKWNYVVQKVILQLSSSHNSYLFFLIQDYNVRTICFHCILHLLGHVVGDQELVAQSTDQQLLFWAGDESAVAIGVACLNQPVEYPPVAWKISME
eukprot:4686274-Ditylum_brightwellii.AAC.1